MNMIFTPLTAIDSYKTVTTTTELVKSKYEVTDVSCDLRSADSVGVEINTGKSEKLIVLGIYRLHAFTCSELINEINDLCNSNQPNVMICGDMNLDILTNNNIAQECLVVMSDHGLKSLINSPKRTTADSIPCIDHVSVRLSPSYCIAAPPRVIRQGITDHDLLCIKLKTTTSIGPTTNINTQITNYDNVLMTLVNTDWSATLNHLDANESTELLTKIISTTISQKTRKIRIRQTHNLLPWN